MTKPCCAASCAALSINSPNAAAPGGHVADRRQGQLVRESVVTDGRFAANVRKTPSRQTLLSLATAAAASA